MKKIFLVILASMFLTANAQIFEIDMGGSKVERSSTIFNNSNQGFDNGGLDNGNGQVVRGNKPGQGDDNVDPSGYSCLAGCGLLVFLGVGYLGVKYHRNRKDVREDDNKGH